MNDPFFYTLIVPGIRRQWPFLFFLFLHIHTQKIWILWCLEGLYLQIALNLPKYACFIHVAHAPSLCKICHGVFISNKYLPSSGLLFWDVFGTMSDMYLVVFCENRQRGFREKFHVWQGLKYATDYICTVRKPLITCWKLELMKPDEFTECFKCFYCLLWTHLAPSWLWTCIYL